MNSLLRFLIHLRIHYNAGILSAGYLLALLFFPYPEWPRFGLQFVNVHLLLFGGATAYNSYWDRDTGPIGGLQKPPPMDDWMRWAALGMMFGGLIWASKVGMINFLVYLFSAVLFWGYSSPLIRWKGSPRGSVLVIALSTGFNAFLLGLLAAADLQLEIEILLAALGAGAILVSLYPVSQIYQMEEDRYRGDETFALRYGVTGVRRFFIITFASGAILVGLALLQLNIKLGITFLSICTVLGTGLYMVIKKLRGNSWEYRYVMRIKYGTSLGFVLFILISWYVTYYFGS